MPQQHVPLRQHNWRKEGLRDDAVDSLIMPPKVSWRPLGFRNKHIPTIPRVEFGGDSAEGPFLRFQKDIVGTRGQRATRIPSEGVESDLRVISPMDRADFGLC